MSLFCLCLTLCSLTLCLQHLSAAECGCPATNPGQRLVVADTGARYFSSPCASASGDPGGTASGTSEGTLPKCTTFQVTGKRAPSDCGEEQCYLEISLEGKAYFVADYACGTTASNFGLPGDSRCPGWCGWGLAVPAALSAVASYVQLA